MLAQRAYCQVGFLRQEQYVAVVRPRHGAAAKRPDAGERAEQSAFARPGRAGDEHALTGLEFNAERREQRLSARQIDFDVARRISFTVIGGGCHAGAGLRFMLGAVSRVAERRQALDGRPPFRQLRVGVDEPR